MLPARPETLTSNRAAVLSSSIHSVFLGLLGGNKCAKKRNTTRQKGGRQHRLSKWKLACGSGISFSSLPTKAGLQLKGFPFFKEFCASSTFPSRQTAHLKPAGQKQLSYSLPTKTLANWIVLECKALRSPTSEAKCLKKRCFYCWKCR